jgi:protein TonB
MVTHPAGPIEVFMLEGSGSSASSGGGTKKQDSPRGRPHLEMHRPQAREEARLRPQETSKTLQQKAEPAQTATENITAHEFFTRSETASGIQLESGTGGGQKGKASASSGSAAGAGGGSGRGTGAGEGDAGFGSPSGPKFLHREIPEYPFLARKRKTEGKVVLAVVIDATGRLTKAEVIEASDRTFAEASLEALRKSTFLPAIRNGQPVTSRAILPIRFSLVD